MPPLQREQLINQKIVHCRISFALSNIINNRSEPAGLRSSTSSTSTSTSSTKARTKDRLKRGNEGHIHSSEKPDVASSSRLSSSSTFFASSAALVHPF
ncbi:uncharacterized protein LOC111075039 isoform X2 [Drosophila obscura]|uniref:uncharacterized protein LOC111075039 isoform X2 n=1 Tax=Drosophila obscura TaxID=7282 RepID=UPI000BA18F81|nr:uncharacterized protein LOC111075039 isoform X2 [Drosophila obscura]